MKLVYLLASIALPFILQAQPASQAKNIFIITTDGFRWQEVFTGADSILINNTQVTSDTSLAKAMYWDDIASERRKKLMPFFWNVIAKNGQLYGNRLLKNKMNMKNPYKISYAGYNEILTGYADINFRPNTPVHNNNINILEFLNGQPTYAGKVAAFSSWNIFPYILNEERSKLPVNSGYEMLAEDSLSTNAIINQVQEGINGKKHTRFDLLTFLSAKEYIKTQHPKVIFLGMGETDESAHSSRYDAYLQNAAMFDKMIGELWYLVQTDPFYKDNTMFIITTDHGRGSNASSWNKHSLFTKGSGDTWLAMIGPGITPSGEMIEQQQTYANQLAPTIAQLLGEQFKNRHTLAKPMNLQQEPIYTNARQGSKIAAPILPAED